jgi:ribonuclease J
MARNLGCDSADDLFLRLDELMCSSAQAIVPAPRAGPGVGPIGSQEHRQVNIQRGDTVILSATPIPGNETGAPHSTICSAWRQRLTATCCRYTSPDASQEEQK